VGDVSRPLPMIVAACALAVLGGCADGTDDEIPTAGTSAPPQDAPAQGAGSYVHPTGCISFDPGGAWVQVDETGLGVDFDADPGDPLPSNLPPGGGPAPGDPGVLVSAGCAPLDQVGTSGPVDIPGYDVVDDREVAFGGGSGRVVEYAIEHGDAPVHTDLQFSVDRNDARCTLRAIGSRDAVDALRDEVDAAVETFTCEGR
jgi:hypothetical protein